VEAEHEPDRDHATPGGGASGSAELPAALVTWADGQRGRVAATGSAGEVTLPPGTELPPVCLKCGAVESLVRRRRFGRPSMGFGSLAPFIWLASVLLFRWRLVLVYLCAACDAARSRDARARRLFAVGLLVVGTLGTGALEGSVEHPDGELPGLIMALQGLLGAVTVLPALYLLLTGARFELNFFVRSDWNRHAIVWGAAEGLTTPLVRLSALAVEGGAAAVRERGPTLPLQPEPAGDEPADVRRTGQDAR